MGVNILPARLNSLPTFTYSKATQAAVTRHTGGSKQNRTLHKATSTYKGKIELTRRISENMIDLARWKGQRKPRWYPAHLQHPTDMLQAVLYRRAPSTRTRTKSKKSKSTRNPSYRVADTADNCKTCNNAATTIANLCNCDTTPWDTHNTETWRQQNIDLRWRSDTGIGTFALQSFAATAILGEYVGELVRTDDTQDSRYLFDVRNAQNQLVACIDSLRVGNWTRYINHSCVPNTSFQVARVGVGVRVVVVVEREIPRGEEITVDYGEGYWESMRAKGIWCRCGEEACLYSEEAAERGKGRGKEKAKEKGKPKMKKVS